MPGDILNFLTVQCTQEGAGLNFPNLFAYVTNGGQDPEDFTNQILTGFENTALSLAWRAYDRAIRQYNDVNQQDFYIWQGNNIWQLFDGVNWSSALAVAAQASTLDFGVHTGLYHVTKEDGTEFVCGLFKATAGGIGFVKWDPRTNLWTTGVLAGTTNQGNTMGKCVPFKGKLYHASVGSKLQEFDPADDSLFEYDYSATAGGGAYATIATIAGRLFLFPDTGAPQLCEFAFGAVFPLLTIAPEPIGSSYTSGGDCIAFQEGADNVDCTLTYIWNCQTGGSGFRIFSCEFTAGSARGTQPNSFQERDAIPDGDSGCDTFSSFCNPVSYLGDIDPGRSSSVPGNQNYQFTEGAYQLEQSPVFTPSAGFPTLPAFQPQMLKLNNGSLEATPIPPNPFPPSRRIDGPGPLSTFFGYVHVTGVPVSTTYAQNTGPWANVERLLGNGPSITNIMVEPYSDGTVTRGLRLTFKVRSGVGLGELGSDLYFGYGRSLTRPHDRMSLSVGDNSPTLFPGGVATFDAGTNRFKDIPPGDIAGPRGVIFFTGPSGSFTIGEIVEGGTSGARGIARIENTAAGSVQLSSLTGGPFQAGETLTGLTSGETATAVGPEDRNVTYQIIWDVGASGDNIPEREWVTIQGVHFNGTADGVRCGMIGSGTYAVQVLTDVNAGQPPATTGGPVAEVATDTSASPLTTGGPIAEVNPDASSTPLTTGGPIAEAIPDTSQSPATTGGPVAEVISGTSATPVTTGGPIAEVEPDADLEGNLLRRTAPGSQTVDGGGDVEFEDDAGIKGARAALDLLSSTLIPGQVWEPDPLLPAGPKVTMRLDGKVELGRATFDAELDAVGTRRVVLDVDAEGYGALGVPPANLPVGSILGVGALLVVVRAVDVTGVITTQPEISLGVGGSFDDQVAQTALALTATGQNEQLALILDRPLLLAGAVLEAQLDVQAVTSGDYSIEVVVYGFHRVG